MTAPLQMPLPNAKPITAVENKRAYRDALGRFATGVTIITTNGSQGPVGMTANSFASVSLEPALVLWSLAKSSGRFAPFAQAQHYSIHILAEEQTGLALSFAKNGAPFDLCDWHLSENSTPLIGECLARFDCQKSATHDAGDHLIIVGEVMSFEERTGKPLIFANSGFGGFEAE